MRVFTHKVLWRVQDSRAPKQPARILNLYIEAWTWFRHVFCPDGLNNCSPKVPSLKMVPSVRMVGGMYVPRAGGEGMRSPGLLRQGPAYESVSAHILLMASSNNNKNSRIYLRNQKLVKEYYHNYKNRKKKVKTTQKEKCAKDEQMRKPKWQTNNFIISWGNINLNHNKIISF